jgi:hypothetical protein
MVLYKTLLDLQDKTLKAQLLNYKILTGIYLVKMFTLPMASIWKINQRPRFVSLITIWDVAFRREL